MVLYVVMDLMGEGRLVGVYDDEKVAQRVVGEFPEYYKIHRCRLNHLNPEVIDWSRNEEQRRWLQQVLDDE